MVSISSSKNVTMHLIGLHKVIRLLICLVAAKCLDIYLQILAHVFIHDRKQEEELFVHTFL